MSNRKKVGDGVHKPRRGGDPGPEEGDGEDDHGGDEAEQVVHTQTQHQTVKDDLVIVVFNVIVIVIVIVLFLFTCKMYEILIDKRCKYQQCYQQYKCRQQCTEELPQTNIQINSWQSPHYRGRFKNKFFKLSFFSTMAYP